MSRVRFSGKVFSNLAGQTAAVRQRKKTTTSARTEEKMKREIERASHSRDMTQSCEKRFIKNFRKEADDLVDKRAEWELKRQTKKMNIIFVCRKANRSCVVKQRPGEMQNLLLFGKYYFGSKPPLQSV